MNKEYLFDNDYRNLEAFEFTFDKMSLDGALFDINKLQFFAREILARKNKHQMLELAKAYAETNLFSFLEGDSLITVLFNISLALRQTFNLPGRTPSLFKPSSRVLIIVE